MGEQQEWLGKLDGEHLRSLATTPGDETADVLIKLHLGVRKVTFDRSPRTAVRPRPTGIQERDGDPEEAATRVDQARKLLRDILGEEPLWLDAARAFSVRVTGEQLRNIASSPLVARVYLNRKLR